MLLALLFCYIKIESRHNKAKFAYFIQKITIIYAKKTLFTKWFRFKMQSYKV